MASIGDVFLRKFVAIKKDRVVKDGMRKPSFPLDKLENCICEILRIIVWDDPDYSLNCLILVNTVFCLLIYMEFRIFGAIFLLLLGLTVEKLFTDYLHKFAKKEGLDDGSNSVPKATPRFLTDADIPECLKKSHKMVNRICGSFRRYKKAEPGMFCFFVCISFIWMNVLGQSITSLKMFYFLLMPIMILPGVFNHFSLPHFFSNFTDYFFSSRTGDKENDDEVESYLPENTPENLELLNLAGDLHVQSAEDEEESNDLLLERISARTSDTTESVSSKMSFYPESSLMPSPETSMDFLELDLLSGGGSHPDREKFESNGSENSEINFQSQHFDGESSDEDEEFVKGLTMNENEGRKNKYKKEVKGQSDNGGPSILNPGNFMTVGATLLNAIKNSKKPSTNDKESSDDTDSFEIISDEDM